MPPFAHWTYVNQTSKYDTTGFRNWLPKHDTRPEVAHGLKTSTHATANCYYNLGYFSSSY